MVHTKNARPTRDKRGGRQRLFPRLARPRLPQAMHDVQHPRDTSESTRTSEKLKGNRWTKFADHKPRYRE